MLQRITAILAIITLGYTCSEAQVVLRSVDDAWRYADEHNATIMDARYEVRKSGAAKTQSKLAFLPQINANASVTDNTNLPTTLVPVGILGPNPGSGDVLAVKFGQRFVNIAGITGQLDIVNPQTWYNVRTARETDELNRAHVANVKKETYQQIANQYYGYLLSREAERLAGLSTSVADSVAQSINNKYVEGMVNEANVDLANLNFERAKQTYVNAQYQARISLNELKGSLNMPLTDSLLIAGSLRENIPEDNPANFTEDPAITAANYQQRVNYSMYKGARATVIPTLSLAYSNTVQQNSNSFEPFSGVNTYPASYIAVRLNWSIFTAGTRWLQVQRNKISYLQSMADYEHVVKQSAINDENIILGYRKTAAAFRSADRIMNLSYDNYQHISERYKEGLASIEERLEAFKDYITYQNLYLNAASDVLVQLYQVRIRQESLK